MERMDITTILGLLIAFGCIILSFLGEGGKVGGLWSATAMPVILGGTAGAVLVSFPLQDLKLLGRMFRTVFSNQKLDEAATVSRVVRFSEIARREGLLALDAEIEGIGIPLIEKGLRLIIDGTESQNVKDILSRDLSLQMDAYTRGARIFAAAGGFSTAMGIVGTVVGVIGALGHGLNDLTVLAQKTALAFVATLYGVSLANLLWLPFENKVKAKAAREKLIGEIVIEGILSIQAGDHPDTVREKLNLAFFEKTGGRKGAAPVAAQGGVEP